MGHRKTKPRMKSPQRQEHETPKKRVSKPNGLAKKLQARRQKPRRKPNERLRRLPLQKKSKTRQWPSKRNWRRRLKRKRRTQSKQRSHKRRQITQKRKLTKRKHTLIMLQNRRKLKRLVVRRPRNRVTSMLPQKRATSCKCKRRRKRRRSQKWIPRLLQQMRRTKSRLRLARRACQ